MTGEAVEAFHTRFNNGTYSEIYTEASPELHRVVPIHQLQRRLVDLARTHGKVRYSTQTGITFGHQDNGGPDLARVLMDTEYEFGAANEEFVFSLRPAVLLEGYAIEITRHDGAEMWQARGFGPEGPPVIPPAAAVPPPDLPPELLERLPPDVRRQLEQRP